MSKRVTTIAEFKAYVVSVGATLDLEQERDVETYMVDAPVGKVWGANGCHTLSVPFGNWMGQFWRRDAIKDIVDQMSDGLEDCTTPDCDVCEENRAAHVDPHADLC